MKSVTRSDTKGQPKGDETAPGSPLNTTFVNGLALLEALASEDATAGVTELARQLGLTKSNVHRLLQTLVDRGYVQGAGGRYQVTLKLWELGSGVLDRLDVKRVSYGYMERLAELTGETVHLSLLEQAEVVYIDKVDSPQPVRAYSKIGGRAPAYCVATGKALLAHAPEAIVAAAARALQPHTPLTLRNEHELRAELRRIAAAGYAINRGEWRERVCGLAAPIQDARGTVIAAIGISGPVERLKIRTLRNFAPAVVESARAISTQLGCKVDVA